MPATAVLRRLCALVPLVAAVILGSSLVLSPAALAAPQAGSSGAAARGVHANQVGIHLLEYRINHAADVAIDHIGDPYHYGAEGPHSFDCSGLSLYSYSHSHMSLPRSAAEQYAAVHHILKMHLIRGDLVFFHDSSGHVFHVGMFLYWNSHHIAVIIHAPHTGTVVQRQTVWTTAWYAGTRRP